jgi:hypothetical protein
MAIGRRATVTTPAKPRRTSGPSGRTRSEREREERGNARLMLRVDAVLVRVVDRLRGSRTRSQYVTDLVLDDNDRKRAK